MSAEVTLTCKECGSGIFWNVDERPTEKTCEVCQTKVQIHQDEDLSNSSGLENSSDN